VVSVELFQEEVWAQGQGDRDTKKGQGKKRKAKIGSVGQAGDEMKTHRVL